MRRRAGRNVELLPGEDCDNVQPSDAAHWVRVYEELLRAVDLLLMERARGADSVSPDWLMRRRDRLRRRLAWWRARKKA